VEEQFEDSEDSEVVDLLGGLAAALRKERAERAERAERGELRESPGCSGHPINGEVNNNGDNGDLEKKEQDAGTSSESSVTVAPLGGVGETRKAPYCSTYVHVW